MEADYAHWKGVWNVENWDLDFMLMGEDLKQVLTAANWMALESSEAGHESNLALFIPSTTYSEIHCVCPWGTLRLSTGDLFVIRRHEFGQ